MKGRLVPWLVIGGIVLVIIIIVGMFFGTYNSLVTKSQAVDAQWAQVETQYQRRFELIDNLVASVKGIMKQELAVYGEITQARTKYSGAITVNEKDAAGVEAGAVLGRLIAIVESNPQLVSQASVSQLMDNLEGTENRVSVERRRYNQVVQDYNTAIKKVPTNIIASMFNFGPKEYFQSVSSADQAPKVEF
ncbi:MAG: hypothetical protein A2Z28_05145 [Chloroflexi bacterium RBG_16_51_9]|nr:MAG: hypothetical protein A2Z28_05145 [Chloroflexi bacterium RBG_16_51_9]